MLRTSTTETERKEGNENGEDTVKESVDVSSKEYRDLPVWRTSTQTGVPVDFMRSATMIINSFYNIVRQLKKLVKAWI